MQLNETENGEFWAFVNDDGDLEITDSQVSVKIIDVENLITALEKLDKEHPDTIPDFEDVWRLIDQYDED